MSFSRWRLAYAADPGEFTEPGFNRWTKTWCIEFASTSEVYWNANSTTLNIQDLPARAFDSTAQYEETRKLFDDYNGASTLTPQIDARFAALAQQRIRSHAWRYYVELPLLRLADMWLRPRTEMLWVELRWWEYSEHNAVTEFAAAYAALNLLYLLLAFAGACRRPRLVGAMLAFVALRSILLATLEAPEPRYTLECFPIVIALAGIALARKTAPPRPDLLPNHLRLRRRLDVEHVGGNLRVVLKIRKGSGTHIA